MGFSNNYQRQGRNCCAALALVICMIKVQAQLTPIPSPTGYQNNSTGYFQLPIEIGGMLYARYLGNDGNYDLGKFDGTNLTIISSSAGYENSAVGYFPPRIGVGTELYLRYQGNDLNYDLAKYDGASLTIIQSPSGFDNGGAGFQSDDPQELGGAIYMRYLGNDGNSDLVKCDGTVLTVIHSPAGYENNGNGYTAFPFKLGSNLYMQFRGNDGNYDLAKYDGNTLTIIPSPAGYENSGRGYAGSPIAIGGTLYMRYLGNDSNYDLVKYDGTTLTVIPSPVGHHLANGYTDNPIAVGSTLYMRYQDNGGNFDLVKYDGTTLTVIPSPAGYENNARGYWSTVFAPPVTSGGILYMQYRDNSGNLELGTYDGINLTIALSPAGYENPNRGYISSPIIINGVLYLLFQGNDLNNDLAKYDMSNISIIPSPSGYENASSGYLGDPVIYASSLYLRYRGNDTNSDLAKYDGTTLTHIPSPTGYHSSNYGYDGTPYPGAVTLYLRYRDTGANYDLMTFTEPAEINIQGNNQNISDGDMSPSPADHTDFGNVALGSNLARIFTIQNTSTSTLLISSCTSNNARFVVTGAPTSIGGLGSATFTVTYTPTVEMLDNAVITVNNSDSDEGVYDFAIQGAGVAASEPEINLQGNSVSIADGDTSPGTADHTDFGNVILGNSLARVFTIQNTGTASLTISSITSDNAKYVVSGAPTSVGAASSATFTVTYTPTVAGTDNATITVNNDDSDEAVYDFAITGVGVAVPEINLQGNSVSIADGDTSPGTADHTDFGNVILGNNLARVFTIQNTGTASLSISSITTGNVKYVVSGVPTSVGAAGSATFTVTYTPNIAGTDNATITVNNDDSDEAVYDFAITGVGVAVPEINLQGNSVSIADGDTSPGTADHTDFGNVILGNSLARVFTIQNTGTASLSISSITTGNAKFVVSGAPTSVGTASSAAFTVTYTPTVAGTDNATITVNNNDSDEGVYDFAIQGTGVGVPEINIQGNGVSIADGDTSPTATDHSDFGNINLGSSLARSFTIQNLGTATLSISSITSDNATFVISGTPGSVDPSSSATFTVTYTPTADETNSATIVVNNDDSDEGTYDFTVQGTGVAVTALDYPVVGDNLKVCPNPSNGTFIIGPDHPGPEAEVSIFDLQGREVWRSKLGSTNNVVKTDLSSGVYLLNFTSNGHTRKAKVVIF